MGTPGMEMPPKFEDRVRAMGTCIEVAAIITSTLDFNELLSLVMEKSKEMMNAQACSILLYNPDTEKLESRLALHEGAGKAETTSDKVDLEMGQGIAGWAAQNQEPVLVVDARKDPRFSKDAEELRSFATKSLIAVPITGRSGLIGVAEIMNPKHKEHFDRFDLEVFQTHTRQVAIAIENARYHEESLKRERLRNELEIAAALQRSFLPEPPVLKKGKISISAVNISAANIGGDFYDFIERPDETLGVVVGDVSGKGISGALYMSKIISDFRYIALTSGTTKEAFERLNARLSRAPRGMFLTATYVMAETHTGRLHISVAGHPPALWLREDGLRVLDAPAGPPLGIKPAEYPASTLTMKEGDRLIIVTDGAYEARDKNGRLLGFKGLVEFLRVRTGETGILEALVEHIKKFSAGAEMSDDLTVVEIAYGGKA